MDTLEMMTISFLLFIELDNPPGPTALMVLGRVSDSNVPGHRVPEMGTPAIRTAVLLTVQL